MSSVVDVLEADAVPISDRDTATAVTSYSSNRRGGPEISQNQVTILFFGVVRPYKGLEDLVDAFALLPRDGDIRWKLLVVGEIWEGWHLPEIKINESPFRDDIEFINRYVLDSELPELFSRANLVALPYRRSSASGPLHVTMSHGLPVVVTNVGGLPEAVGEYSGGVLVQPEDPADLANGILRAQLLVGTSHDDLQSWDTTVLKYSEILREAVTHD